MNNAMAVLSKSGTNPLDPTLLPPRTTAYGDGTVTWSGLLDQASDVWTITSTGALRNPTGATGDVARTLTSAVPVTPAPAQPLGSPAWNYIYSTHTGSTCDLTLQQSVQVGSPLYVNGNLCLQNTASITSGPLQVRGQLTLSQQANSVGSQAAPISAAHIAGGCLPKSGVFHATCSSADNVFATVLDAAPDVVAPPVVVWDQWYLNASPGPYYPCSTQSGTPPAFDNDQGSSPDASRRNGSLGGSFNLTPAGSYTCRAAGGELSWDAYAHRLTIKGTVFIDGSATIDNGTVSSYDGQASLYLSGTLLMKSSQLCAVIASNGSGCSAAGWNPNSRLLVVVANGSGGQVPTGDGIQLVSSSFQGALYATNAIDIDTTSQAIGPMLASTVMLGQSVATSFPPVNLVPVAMPGNPVVFSQVQRPQYSG